MDVEDNGTRYWLYELLTIEERPDSQFAARSTANWARSLALEIVEQHGASPAEQFRSCKDLFEGQPKKSATPPSAAIFEPLFLSLTCSLTVTSAALPEKARSLDWSLPALIVWWYYTHYTAVRAMAVAAGTVPRDTHSNTIDAFGGNLLDRMPHPLNMEARWVKNEEFDCRLPGYPEATRGDQKLTGTFSATRSEARGNLLAYLNGEAGRQVEDVKERLLNVLRKEHPGLKDFRTKAAREARDQKLQKTVVNFMDCAFRYRGKANYRDAIYLTYGSQPLAERDELAAALVTSAQFAVLCALAFVRRRVGAKDARNFVEDVARNLRGVGSATSEELFWKDLPL